VKNVFIPPDSEEDGPPVALEDAMPLLSFLAPVCYTTMLLKPISMSEELLELIRSYSKCYRLV
jgi:hypothetical protein